MEQLGVSGVLVLDAPANGPAGKAASSLLAPASSVAPSCAVNAPNIHVSLPDPACSTESFLHGVSLISSIRQHPTLNNSVASSAFFPHWVRPLIDRPHFHVSQ